MRTTLEIEDDILQAAKELARVEKTTAGRIISKLARRGLTAPDEKPKMKFTYRNGVPILPAHGDVITLEHVQKLMDEEGI